MIGCGARAFSSARCSCKFTRGCALDRAKDNFPGTLQILMLYFAADYYIFKESKMLLVVFWK